MGIINFWPFNKGPHSQFEELISPHLNKLYKLAYRLTGQRDDAEDLVQDLLLKLYPRLDEMQNVDKLSHWLYRVLYRLFVDQYRHKQRSPIDFMSDEEVFYETHASPLADPSEVANDSIIHELINTALQKLSEEHRILIMLHDVEGYSLQEINGIISIPIGTIKSRLSRARSKLKEIMRISETASREPKFVDSVSTVRGYQNELLRH